MLRSRFPRSMMVASLWLLGQGLSCPLVAARSAPAETVSSDVPVGEASSSRAASASSSTTAPVAGPGAAPLAAAVAQEPAAAPAGPGMDSQPAPTPEPPPEGVPSEGAGSEASPEEQPPSEGTSPELQDSTTGSEGETGSEPLPQGEGIDKGSGFKVRGYFRPEFKYSGRNLYYGFDDELGRWTPHGSPYQVYGMVPPTGYDSYLELNFEVSWNRFDWLTGYTDTSLVYTTTRSEQTTFEQLQDLLIGAGNLEAATTPDSGVPIPGAAGSSFVRKERERLQINELYFSTGIPDWLSLTFGKRRISWGSAFTWSPMDVVNPPRNPLEPTLQREGGYNATLELVHFDGFTLSALYKPSVTENARGLPETWDFTENLYVGRVYLNLFDADINLAYFNNRGRHYGGLSFSRYFDVYELHVETLAQRGRPTWMVEEASYGDDPLAELRPPYEVGQFEVDNGRFYADFLVGGRYNFDDGSTLLLEYLYHGAGYNQVEYDRFRGFTAYMQEQASSVIGELQNSDLTAEQQAELELQWAELIGATPYTYLDPNTRRHYLSVTYLKAKMFELIEPKFTGVWNVDDLSAVLYPAVDFTLTREASRNTVKFLAGVLIFLGDRQSQASLYPNRYTANLRMTAYF